MVAFEIDERKLARATEANDLWLETIPGRVFRAIGLLVLVSIGIVLVANLVLLVIAVPGVGAGLVIFAIIVALPIFTERPAPKPQAPRRASS